MCFIYTSTAYEMMMFVWSRGDGLVMVYQSIGFDPSGSMVITLVGRLIRECERKTNMVVDFQSFHIFIYSMTYSFDFEGYLFFLSFFTLTFPL